MSSRPMSAAVVLRSRTPTSILFVSSLSAPHDEPCTRVLQANSDIKSLLIPYAGRQRCPKRLAGPGPKSKTGQRTLCFPVQHTLGVTTPAMERASGRSSRGAQQAGAAPSHAMAATVQLQAAVFATACRTAALSGKLFRRVQGPAGIPSALHVSSSRQSIPQAFERAHACQALQADMTGDCVASLTAMHMPSFRNIA